MSWADAAQHLATRAARRFKLEGRGVIRAGAYADLVVLRPSAMAYIDDVWAVPHPAGGVEHVFVNGVRAVADGAVTGARSGQALRRYDGT